MYILELSYGCPNKRYPSNGNFQFDQAKALQEIGNKIVFAAIDMRSIRKKRRLGLYSHMQKDIYVVEYNIPFGPLFPNLRVKVQKRAFRKILKRVIKDYGRPEVVHSHFGDFSECIVDECMKIGLPFVVTEHSSNLCKKDLSQKYIMKLKNVYSKAKKVIAVSVPLSERIKEISGIKAVVIPNIVDFSIFKLNKQYHQTFRFVSAGNLIYRKGFDLTIRAFREMLKLNYKVELVIMGDGKEKDYLQKLVNDLKIQDYVSFFGKYNREDFNDMLSRSDAFVLASRGETFGVVYAEAMATGTPVIATKCGGPEDFVSSNNGIIVEMNNVPALLDAMIFLYEHIEEYDNKRISEETVNRFSSNTVANQIVSLFKADI